MPVFISHRTLDDVLAKRIYDRLTRVHSIRCWLDNVYPAQPPDKITEVILTNINRCTHLLVVMTDNTEGSWWVPYEIGVAEQGERAISTYSEMLKLKLPEFLWHWPVLMGDSAIDRFAQIYKQERLIVETTKAANIRESLSNSVALAAATRSTPAQFHSKLKSALGQK